MTSISGGYTATTASIMFALEDGCTTNATINVFDNFIIKIRIYERAIKEELPLRWASWRSPRKIISTALAVRVARQYRRCGSTKKIDMGQRRRNKRRFRMQTLN